MDSEGPDIWPLVTTFGLLSIFSVGGGIAALLPEVQRQAVDVHGWMTVSRFRDLFAIAQAAPGPGMLLVTLIGHHVGAVPGAIIATLAFIAPSGVITYWASRLVHSAGNAPWRIIMQNALVPVSLGLIAAAAYSISSAAVTSVLAGVILLGAAALGFLPRLHPLLTLAAGGAIGFFWLR